jgi:hypothetical protein
MPIDRIQILGIDAAVDPKNVGLATAVSDDRGRWRLAAVEAGERGGDLAGQAVDLIDRDRVLVLAVDAPLGWPRALARSLAGHAAGEPIDAGSDDLFVRETDRYVRRHTGLKPLEVGADRIARTARAALALVDGIRRRSGQLLPLVLQAEAAASGGLLEVYPAATLAQRGLPAKGYKKPEARDVRSTILEGIGNELDPGPHASACLDSDHCLDAALCVLTAIDVLAGRCAPPQETESARAEGWIWFPARG